MLLNDSSQQNEPVRDCSLSRFTTTEGPSRSRTRKACFGVLSGVHPCCWIFVQRKLYALRTFPQHKRFPVNHDFRRRITTQASASTTMAHVLKYRIRHLESGNQVRLPSRTTVSPSARRVF